MHELNAHFGKKPGKEEEKKRPEKDTTELKTKVAVIENIVIGVFGEIGNRLQSSAE